MGVGRTIRRKGLEERKKREQKTENGERDNEEPLAALSKNRFEARYLSVYRIRLM